MKPSRLRAKVAAQWGLSSEEFAAFIKLSEKADAWDKYEYEKFGLGLHSDETKRSEITAPMITEPKLPSDREITRATWTYFLARAAWIMMAWAVFFGFMIALFAMLYWMVRG